MSSETREETDEDGYVHRPETLHDADDESETSEESGLGRVGWLLVGVVALTFLVIPGAIYLFPAAPGQAGIPFLVAMLALPFVPALLLGLVAVWTAVANRQ